MVVAIILVLVAVGTVVFHFWSPWWFTPIASNWGSMDTTIVITFWVTGVVFIAVILFTAYCVFRFRYQPNRRAEYEPENKKLEVWLSALTAVGVAVLLAPGLIIWNNYVTVPDDAAEIEVVGAQWDWKYRYPGADGVLGTSDVRLISDDNPFGLNPGDANGKDDILVDSDDLHLPIDKSVNVLLRSIDVLHDFYVPQFRAKMDMVPGLVSFFWLTPPAPEPSTYCAPSFAVRATMPCAAKSWSKSKRPLTRGWPSSRHSLSSRLQLKKKPRKVRPWC